MTLSEDVRTRIESLIGSDRVVLFMKGTPQMPQCGFSATTVGILDSLVPKYTTFNVLEDPDVREGIKAYSEWPTIPQLYIDREFVGGCDIVKQMFNTGALHEALGADPPDRTPPQITLSDEAADLIRNALAEHPDMSVHLQIDARWQHGLSLGRGEGHEVRAGDKGVAILMDVASAQKAKGLSIGLEDTLQGRGFSFENPNAPPPVNQLSAVELRRRFQAGEALHLFDVRPESERSQARIPEGRALDDHAMRDIATLPRDAMLVFYCHTGTRSQAAAEHFRLQGHSNVHNLTGGIDAWSREVDPSVPRY